MEFHNAARREAIERQRIRQVIEFCGNGRRVSVASITPIVNQLDGEQVVGHDLVLQGGRKRNHLRTCLDIFRLAALSVSRDAWEYSLTAQGRRLIENITTVGLTAYSIKDPKTIFSLAADRKNHSVINHGS